MKETEVEAYRPKSVQQLEASLPTLMRERLPRLRMEYLSIPIQERMYWTYDYFLRMKVLEHLRWRAEKYGVRWVQCY